MPLWSVFVLTGLSLGAQVTNTGELTSLAGTEIVAVSDFRNTVTGSVNNNGKLFLYADFINDGSFSFRTDVGGTVYFQGNSVQRLSGNGTNDFYSAVFNNPSGPVAFELSAALNVSNNADFVLGIIDNDNFGGSILFKSSAGHTSASDSGYVDGTVRKEGNTTFMFPIGDGGFHRPSSISAPNVNTVLASRYVLENSDTVHPHNAFRGIIGFIDDMEYWALDHGSGALNVALTLQWDPATTPNELLIADADEIHIVRWDTDQGAWVDEGGTVNAANLSVATNASVRGYGVFTLAKVSTDETDSDGDGVPDFVENNAMPPTDPSDPNDYIDTDGDGVPDYVENNTAPASDPNDRFDFADADNDGLPDLLDSDDNNADTDGDGIPDGADSDVDGDGTADNGTDSDGDGINDEKDADIDGDGVNDNGTDTDGDGINDENDTVDDNMDSDGDGLPDALDPDPNDPDTDGDGIPDGADSDVNGDGITDNGKDTDGDGIRDGYDADINGDGILDNGSDSDGDGINDANDFENSGNAQVEPAEAITPNSDGVNDTWVVKNIESYPGSKVRVYNRWGHEVFAAVGYRNDWKGNHASNSEVLPSGSYFYVIDLGNGSVPKQGWLFINY